MLPLQENKMVYYCIECDDEEVKNAEQVCDICRLKAEKTYTGGDQGIAPGSIINNEYYVEQHLGQGGMGSVFKVYHKTNKQTPFALKTVASQKFEERFGQEMAILEKINRVKAKGRAGGLPFFVEPFFEGQTLEETLKNNTLSEQQKCDIAIGILDELGEIHRQNIIHRDVKPSNIIYNGESVKIIDFGLAKFYQEHNLDLTQDNCRIGTYIYMSPEQFYDSKAVDKRCDLYPVGLIIYRMFAEKHPFSNCKTTEIPQMHKSLSAILQGTQTNKTNRKAPEVENLSPKIRLLLSKALHPEISERFSSAEEFKEAITKLQDCTLQEFQKYLGINGEERFLTTSYTPRKKREAPENTHANTNTKSNSISQKAIAITIFAIIAILFWPKQATIPQQVADILREQVKNDRKPLVSIHAFDQNDHIINFMQNLKEALKQRDFQIAQKTRTILVTKKKREEYIVDLRAIGKIFRVTLVSPQGSLLTTVDANYYEKTVELPQSPAQKLQMKLTAVLDQFANHLQQQKPSVRFVIENSYNYGSFLRSLDQQISTILSESPRWRLVRERAIVVTQKKSPHYLIKAHYTTVDSNIFLSLHDKTGQLIVREKIVHKIVEYHSANAVHTLQNVEHVTQKKHRTPTFSLTFSIDKPVVFNGDTITFFVQAQQKCYLRLLYADSAGKIYQFFPNKLYKDDSIDANIAYTIPKPQDNFELTIQCDAYQTETVIAIACTSPFPPFPGNEINYQNGSIKELYDDLPTLMEKLQKQTIVTQTLIVQEYPRDH